MKTKVFVSLLAVLVASFTSCTKLDTYHLRQEYVKTAEAEAVSPTSVTLKGFAQGNLDEYTHSGGRGPVGLYVFYISESEDMSNKKACIVDRQSPVPIYFGTPAGEKWDYYTDGHLNYRLMDNYDYYNKMYPAAYADVNVWTCLDGLESETTYYYYLSSRAANGNEIVGEVKSFKTKMLINGHSYVDLGLPSGTLWATCNVGAVKPEDSGFYLAWGETAPKSIYDWTSYNYCNGSSSTLKKYCCNSQYGNGGFVDNLETLEASDDAATANWGTSWRMPTLENFNELESSCSAIWMKRNGVDGYLFVGQNYGAIFLPATGSRVNDTIYYGLPTGEYWTSSLVKSQSNEAYYYREDSIKCRYSFSGRCNGLTVRPVSQSIN